MKIDINKIIKNFDFEKIHAYMVLTNWRYRGNDTPPSIKELKETAYFLLNECLKSIYKDENTFHFNRTGGFNAFYNHYDKILSLSFMIERSW